jgi:hypothetical protein
MGVGGYFSIKSEQDNYNYLLRQTQDRLNESGPGVLEREVSDIFKPYGLNAFCIRIISQSLLASDWDRTEMDERRKGPATFILKFGDCLEPISNWRVFCSATTIGLSYFIGGLVPMVHVFMKSLTIDTLFYSCVSRSRTFYLNCRDLCGASHIRVYKGVFDWIEETMGVAHILCGGDPSCWRFCSRCVLRHSPCFKRESISAMKVRSI